MQDNEVDYLIQEIEHFLNRPFSDFISNGDFKECYRKSLNKLEQLRKLPDIPKDKVNLLNTRLKDRRRNWVKPQTTPMPPIPLTPADPRTPTTPTDEPVVIQARIPLLVMSGVLLLAGLLTLVAIAFLITRNTVAVPTDEPVVLVVTAIAEVSTTMPVQEIPLRIERSSVAQITELRALEGHTEHVVRVAIAPDGNTIASASLDGTVKVWDTNTGDLRYNLTGHTDWVRSVAWSPDGKTLASAAKDQTVRLWNADDGTLLYTFPQHTEEVWSVAWSPDGETLASAACASRDYDNCHAGEILLWRKDGTVLHQLQDMESETTGGVSIAFAPDGQTLAVASKDMPVWLWNVRNGTLQERLTGHTDFVWDVAWSPDGHILASVARDQTVRVWNVEDSSVRSLKGHTDFVWGVAWHPDGKILASASKDQTIRLWSAVDGEELRILEGHTDGVVSLAFTSDGQMLASTARDATVRLWGIP